MRCLALLLQIWWDNLLGPSIGTSDFSFLYYHVLVLYSLAQELFHVYCRGLLSDSICQSSSRRELRLEGWEMLPKQRRCILYSRMKPEPHVQMSDDN